MAQWTVEQREVIETRGKNQLVSAAAGSGKTAVLISRILQLIDSGLTSVDRLLVVTFTKAAASEMKERLHHSLSELLEGGNCDSERIRQQIKLLPGAQISTIHAFCKEVISDHFQVLALDPNFKIGRETELSALQTEVLEAIFEMAYDRGDPDFIQTLECYTKPKSDSALREWVKKIYVFSRTHVDPDVFLETVLRRYGESGAEYWEAELKQVLAGLLTGLLEAYNKSIALQTEENTLFYLESFKTDRDQVLDVMQTLNRDVEAVMRRIASFEYVKLPILSKKIKDSLSEEELGVLENIKQYRNTLKDFMRKRIAPFCQASLIDQVKEMQGMLPQINSLVQLVRAYGGLYEERKRQMGILDFSDLEHLAIALLSEKSIQSVYQERYDYVFIDEYQDSNRVQEYILSRVSKERNRFMVGDLKQSIYKFRLADPTLFIETYKRYAVNEEDSRKHDLNKNFRSAEAILKFINHIFRPLMQESFGGIAYDADNQLYPGAAFEMQVPVEIRLINREASSDEEEVENGELPEKIYAEAMEAADAIEALVGKAFCFDPKKQAARLIDYSDIVVLLRSVSTSGAVYRDVFFERGIPLFTETQTGYFDAVEIEIFLQFLRLIDNRTLDLPLMATMRSQVGGFTLEELVAIRLKNRSKSFYDGVVAYIADESDALAIKLKTFMDQVQYFQILSTQLNLDTFLWRLLLETPYYVSLGALYQGENKQANLRLLINRAQDYLQTERTSLHGFLSHIDDMIKKEVDFSEARLIHEKDNVVKLMTIHKSKGLEYPVVILGGLGKKFNEMDLRDTLILHETIGISTSIIDPQLRFRKNALSHSIVKYKMKQSLLEEELRILYVAMTRAVHRLILIGSVRSLSKSIEKWQWGVSGHNLMTANHLLDFVMMALSTAVLKGSKLRHMAESSSYSMGEPVQLNIAIKQLSPGSMDPLMRRPAMDQEALMGALSAADPSDFGGYVEPYSQQSAFEMPTKLSVTEFKHLMESSDSTLLQIPDLSDVRPVDGQGGAVRGTQIHSMLEYLPFPYQDFQDAYDKTVAFLLEKGMISEDVLKTIDPMAIDYFFKSPLGERMAKARYFKREQPFVLRLDEHPLLEKKNEETALLLQGVIDVYFEEEDGIVLMDYKSDQLQADQIEHWQKRYALTLGLYADALEKLSGRPVKEIYIYSTYNQSFIDMCDVRRPRL